MVFASVRHCPHNPFNLKQISTALIFLRPPSYPTIRAKVWEQVWERRMIIKSARKVEATKLPGRYSAGNGIYLVVSPKKHKTWILRYQVGGRRRDMGIGAYPTVSLAEARHRGAEARRQISRGLDPIAVRKDARKAAQPVPTFDDMAQLVTADIDRKSTNEKVQYRAKLLLGKSYCSALLARPINTISAADIARLLNKVRAKKPETARKLHGFLSKVFEVARVVLRDEHGVALGDLPTNLKDLKALGYDPRVRNKAHPALSWVEAPKLSAALRKREGIATRALEVALLTGLREAEVSLAEWPEIDLEAGIWTIPVNRLKDRQHRSQPHRVPLSRRVSEVIRSLNGLSEKWIFPGLVPKRPIAPQSLLQALKSLNKGADGKVIWLDSESKKPIVVHGLRATLRTWAEDNGFRREAAEQTLGHSVGSAVEVRYRRTDILDERRKLLEAWSDFCSSKPSSKVVPMLRVKRA